MFPAITPPPSMVPAEQRLSAGLSAAPLPGSSLPIASSKASGTASAWPPPRALFSSIDWDDDDHHHHDDDYRHGDYSHNGDNININVNNFNHITGENLPGNHVNWQHNPAYRGHTPYPDNTVAQRFHQTNVSGGLSATQHAPVDREAQRRGSDDPAAA